MRPPKYCEPKAPASNASGRKNAIARADPAYGKGVAGPPLMIASLMRCLARLLTRRGRRNVGRRRQPLDGLQRIVELKVLDAVLLQRRRSHHEPRIWVVIRLEQLVLHLRLGEQVPAEI